MTNRRVLLVSLLGTIAGAATPRTIRARGSEQSAQAHITWVADALIRMRSIRPGMTRTDLLKVFTTEGGLSTGLQRTFVSRDCLYFKVDVEFEAVGRPSRGRDGRVTLVEDGRDVIVKMSKPYLELAVMD